MSKKPKFDPSRLDGNTGPVKATLGEMPPAPIPGRRGPPPKPEGEKVKPFSVYLKSHVLEALEAERLKRNAAAHGVLENSFRESERGKLIARMVCEKLGIEP